MANKYTIAMLPGISKLDDLLDAIMLNRPTKAEYSREKMIASINTNVEMQAKPALANVLLVLIPLFCIFPPVMIFVLPLVVLDTMLKTYSLEVDRVVVRSGIIYKRQLSLLYKNVDNIEKSQGLLGKIFKNGKINLHTIGSRFVEMQLTDISNYNEVFVHLQTKVGKK